MEKYYIHSSSFIDDNVSIGSGTKIWHFCHVQSGASIGKNCVLGQNVNVSRNVKIGNGVKFQNNIIVCEGVELEDYVFVGPSSSFTNDLTPRAKYPKGTANYKRTLVRTGASIGANVAVVCGNTIGKWAFVGAGAVITSDVPDHALMLGVPARRAGWVCECGKTLGESLQCSCGRSYRIGKNGLEEILCSSEI